MLRAIARSEGTFMTEHVEHHHVLSYADEVRRFSADKDTYFRTGHERTPLPSADRASFAGVPYFPVDEAFIAEELVLEPYTGDEPRYRRESPRPTGASGLPRGRASSASRCWAPRSV